MSRLPALAVRNVGRNRRRSLITGIAIFICMVMVMILRGFIDAAQSLMEADVVEGRSGALQVHKTGYVDNIEAVPTRLNMPYSAELLAKLRGVPGVKGVSGRIMFNGLVGNGLTQTMFVGRGVDIAHEEDACPRAHTIVKAGGQPLSLKDSAAALLGFELAESFGTQLGDTVTVQSNSPSGRANALDLKVKGFSTSSFPFENKRVLSVPLSTAQSLIGLEGKVTEYALAVSDLNRLEQTRDAVQSALGPQFEVHTWKELNTFVRDVINRQNMVMGAIAAVLFIIALTVIGNTMLMSVFERVREIGTLLAVGVKRRQVLQMFIIEAAVLGLLGGLAGAVAGRLALFAVEAAHLELQMPGTSGMEQLVPSVTPFFVVGAIVIATLGAVLASALPALRASRLNPVDALRNS